MKLIDTINKHRQMFPINQGIATLEVWHLLDNLLKLQKNIEVEGDILEIGVLKGATISFLAKSIQKDERVFLIDPFTNLEEIKKLISDFANLDAEKIFNFSLDSKRIAKRHSSIFGVYNPQLRLIHIDGEHSYDAVYSDLDLSYKYLVEGGLIVLDDMFSIPCACCTQAMFDYLNFNPNLQCVAIGLNKGFVCHSKYLNTYRKFFVNLPQLLEDEGNLYLRLCFNSWGYERSYVTFHLREKNSPKYQAINKYCQSLEEIRDFLDIDL